jgi:hypothetical protein
MITDALPRNDGAGFLESDRIKTLDLPQNGSSSQLGRSMESIMRTGRSGDVRVLCAEFLEAASDFYRVPDCGIRVLTARPLRVRERSTFSTACTISSLILPRRKRKT